VSEFYSGIPGSKLPADPGSLFIASGNPGLNLMAHFLYGRYPAVQALTSYYPYPYLKLSHIQPGTVFGRMVNLEPFRELPRLRGRKCLI
jgi:hypothetical protein